jgi:hypothetical protein
VLLLTEDAVLACLHPPGRVANRPSQSLVTIDGRRVLLQDDPEGRTISGCPNVGATIKPCQKTLRVRAGYSTFVRIDGRPICLDTLVGRTDGTPPGTVDYVVRRAGQSLTASLS